MLKAISLLLAAVMLLPASAVVSNDPPDVDIIAPYYIVVDADDPSIVYYDRDPDEHCIPASTMKIMTCILVLENVENLDDTIVVTKQAAGMKESNSLMHVIAGETLTVRQLLYGMMLVSGNDAALLLATYVAGSVADFAELANAKAAELGMNDTHFTNASGAFNSKQYSTARDMAVLTSYALKNEMFCTLISTVSYTIEANDVRKEPLELVNSNRLISDDPTSDCYSELAFGGKTGSTPTGGDCLVAVGQLDGASVIVVLIGADDTNHRDANKRMPHVFQNAKYLMEYTLENDYTLVTPSSIGFSYTPSITASGLSEALPITTQFDDSAGVRLPAQIANEIIANPSLVETTTEVTADLTGAQTGDAVGTITCTYNGDTLFSGNLIASADAVTMSAASVIAAESTPEPTAQPEKAGLSLHLNYGAGVYIFASISLLLLCALIILIVFYFKLKLYRKTPRHKALPSGAEHPALAEPAFGDISDEFDGQELDFAEPEIQNPTIAVSPEPEVSLAAKFNTELADVKTPPSEIKPDEIILEQPESDIVTEANEQPFAQPADQMEAETVSSETEPVLSDLELVQEESTPVPPKPRKPRKKTTAPVEQAAEQAESKQEEIDTPASVKPKTPRKKAVTPVEQATEEAESKQEEIDTPASVKPKTPRKKAVASVEQATEEAESTQDENSAPVSVKPKTPRKKKTVAVEPMPEESEATTEE